MMCCSSGLKGALRLVFLREMVLIWEGNKLEYRRYTQKPVSPLMGSEAPCCGDGLSGNCLLTIHFIFWF